MRSGISNNRQCAEAFWCVCVYDELIYSVDFGLRAVLKMGTNNVVIAKSFGRFDSFIYFRLVRVEDQLYREVEVEVEMGEEVVLEDKGR